MKTMGKGKKWKTIANRKNKNDNNENEKTKQKMKLKTKTKTYLNSRPTQSRKMCLEKTLFQIRR